MTSKRRFFVTTALPYANGPFHIGHIMEYIQADTWVRFQRMQGHEVHFVGADDAHGAPIMIAAEKAGKTPQQFVADIAAGRAQYLDGFHIRFDNWHNTDAPENHQLAQDIYRALRKNGLIAMRDIEQFFDPVKGMFLPDRYIKGQCPKCGAADQYGDACEVCGAVYAPTELKHPYSTLSGATPELRKSEHYFFQLSSDRCADYLRDWTQATNAHGQPHLQTEVLNKVREWFTTDENGHGGLADWDISRDAPYFGIEIPDAPGKYFYVWLDAPIGYLASLKNHFDKGQAAQHWHAPSRTAQSFDAFVADPAVEQVHFIGKDIVYFHTLFWPAMLHFSGRKTPSQINVHGFVTVGGEKMSKSRGTGISPLKYLDIGLNPEWLRYYLAAKLTARVEDVDFTPEDFVARVNSDLIGKYVNIASRAAKFISQYFDGKLGYAHNTGDLRDAAKALADDVAAAFEAREYARALREIMAYADRINTAFDAAQPWILAKDEARRAELQDACSQALAGFWLLSVMLSPVLPALTARVARELFGLERDFVWSDATELPQHAAPYQHLMHRIDPKRLDALFETDPPAAPVLAKPAAKPVAKPAAQAMTPTAPTADATQDPFITIDDFAKIDLRIARIAHAEAVEGSTKLLRLTLDVGETTPDGQPRTRNVFSGISSAYKPEDLIGKLTVLVANLAPRKMKFGLSEGMVLAASAADEKAQPGLYILEPHTGAQPGMRVR
ncbi:methionine--tRNA ligase [Thiomonas sp.]|jgi:methionyl-tRNA synthetase|uniref:Methionine--tRNA ligase n=1 Tax=Thiomonas intermedia (strain K12) TaxID=75379 RepID=D5WZ44_THIK1|nr:methionine--tRNA ligase [Thiomonas sp.]